MRITVRVGTRYYRRFRKLLYGNVRSINIMMNRFFFFVSNSMNTAAVI